MEKPLFTTVSCMRVRLRGFPGLGKQCVSHVDGVSDMAPTCWLCGFAYISLWDKAISQLSDTSVPPHMSLVSFKLLPWCWRSEEMRLSKLICGFFKRNFLGFQQFLPLTQSPLVFAARSYRVFTSWHWNPGLGSLV